MFRFKVGNVAQNTSNLSVNWPSNTWQGLIQNAVTAAKVADLNADIDAAGGCGNLLEPVGGVLPANAPVILVTSYLMDADSNSFGALAEDTYILFQNNPSATGGHFGNYNATPGLRTLTMSFGGACSDTVTYQRASLSNAVGATVLFTPAGVASYVNYGCAAPVPPFTVDAGTTPILCRDYHCIGGYGRGAAVRSLDSAKRYILCGCQSFYQLYCSCNSSRANHNPHIDRYQ
jgi:hypothetical protein